jgi:hypothetical protein
VLDAVEINLQTKTPMSRLVGMGAVFDRRGRMGQGIQPKEAHRLLTYPDPAVLQYGRVFITRCPGWVDQPIKDPHDHTHIVMGATFNRL